MLPPESGRTDALEGNFGRQPHMQIHAGLPVGEWNSALAQSCLDAAAGSRNAKSFGIESGGGWFSAPYPPTRTQTFGGTPPRVAAVLNDPSGGGGWMLGDAGRNDAALTGSA